MKEEIEKISNCLQRIERDISGMKVDIAHHIKRTDIHEEEIKTLRSFRYEAIGASKLLALIATLATIAGLWVAYKA